jgi:hypothetical protein
VGFGGWRLVRGGGRDRPTINIRGESYRLKDKKRAGVFLHPSSKADRLSVSPGEFQTVDL